MKYNSIHKFDSLEDARAFVKAIRNVGFNYLKCDKDGGVIYSNGKHKMMICAVDA